MGHKRELTAALLFLMGCGPAWAQTPAPRTDPRPGDRVRLAFLDPGGGLRTITGKLVWLNAREIAVRREGYAQSQVVPLAVVQGLEVSEGMRPAPRAAQGAAIGALVGLVVASPFVAFNDCPHLAPEAGAPARACGGVNWGSAKGAGIGAGLGLILGSLHSEEQWRSAPLSLQVQPGPHGELGLGLQIRF